eukprot:96340_1
MEKLRVGIVFGGKSAEHEVSLQSAKNIVDAIDKSRFDVVLLGIDKQGQWHVSDASNYLLNADDPAHIALRPSATSLAQVPGKHEHQLIDQHHQHVCRCQRLVKLRQSTKPGQFFRQLVDVRLNNQSFAAMPLGDQFSD